MNKSDLFGDVQSTPGLMTDATSENGDRGAASEEPVQADHVGALLCATRMRLGGDLQKIAKILRIRYGYLVAIEDGRFEDLPGVAYSVGFVRAYADYLELDGSEVVRRLREENAGTVKSTRYEFPAPSGESGLPNGGLMVVAICLGMVVYGTWYTMSNADRDAVDLIQEVPARLAVLIDGEALDSLASLAPLAPPDMPQEDGQQFDRVTERPATTIEDAPEQANPERSGVDMGSAEVSTPDVTESEVRSNVSNEDAGLVIELRAKSDSWIQIRDGDDLLLKRLLREGEVYKVPDREGLTLMTSNAGGLEVFVDGEQMPPLGAVGVVSRGVPLSAERLRSGIGPG